MMDTAKMVGFFLKRENEKDIIYIFYLVQQRSEEKTQSKWLISKIILSVRMNDSERAICMEKWAQVNLNGKKNVIIVLEIEWPHRLLEEFPRFTLNLIRNNNTSDLYVN